jgi:hypothetical protein
LTGTYSDEQWWLALGDLLERPPLAKFDPELFRELRRGTRYTPDEVQGFMDELDWTRSDRF